MANQKLKFCEDCSNAPPGRVCKTCRNLGVVWTDGSTLTGTEARAARATMQLMRKAALASIAEITWQPPTWCTKEDSQ